MIENIFNFDDTLVGDYDTENLFDSLNGEVPVRRLHICFSPDILAFLSMMEIQIITLIYSNE